VFLSSLHLVVERCRQRIDAWQNDGQSIVSRTQVSAIRHEIPGAWRFARRLLADPNTF
jgi:hypothetical protein